MRAAVNRSALELARFVLFDDRTFEAYRKALEAAESGPARA